MTYKNLKAFEYTKEIVAARLSNSTASVNKAAGKDVAEFFEEIFNKLVELEDRVKDTNSD